jgi:hypothetical protein
METNGTIKIKEINEFKSKGKIPEDRGFFSSLKIDENDIFFHGGCNDKKEFDQIHILDLSNIIFMQKTNLGSLFRTSLLKVSISFSIRICLVTLLTLYTSTVPRRYSSSVDFLEILT